MTAVAIINAQRSLPLSLSISPAGHLYLYSDPQCEELIPAQAAEKIQSFFSGGSAIGLLRLGITNFGNSLPLSLNFWQQFTKLFMTEVCKIAGEEKLSLN